MGLHRRVLLSCSAMARATPSKPGFAPVLSMMRHHVTTNQLVRTCVNRKTLIELGFVGGVGITAFVAWIAVASAQRGRLTPPPTATTLEAFAESMPAPQRLAAINDGGTTKIVWIGDTAMWSFPSGPACYVFDSKGMLTQWDLETGDGQPTTRLLQRVWQAKSLTVQEAIDFAKIPSQMRILEL